MSYTSLRLLIPLCGILIAGSVARSAEPPSLSPSNEDEASQTFVLFRGQNAETSISLPKETAPEIETAVDVFRAALKEGYGVDIPFSKEGAEGAMPNRIEIVAKKLPMLKDDEAEINFPDAHTLRIEGGTHGIIRTLFRLLEDRGVRFLYQGSHTPGPAHRRRTYYPILDRMEIPVKSEKFDSRFSLGRSTTETDKFVGSANDETRRFFWSWEALLGAKAPVRRHLNMGGAPLRDGISKYDTGMLFPIDRYVESGIFPSDELFPILKGQRFLPYTKPEGKAWYTYWQPCFTSQVAEDEAVKNILAFLEKYPVTKSISLSVNDNGGHCECEACLKADNYKEKNAYGLSNRSNSYYRWVNKVVSRVTKKYPDMMFGLFAYREVFEPPLFELNPNIVVFLTVDVHATIAPEIKRQREEDFQGWAKVAKHLGIWSYEVGPLNWSLPRAYYQAEQELMQSFNENKGDAAFAESGHFFTLSEGPKMYLHFKLLENPYLDRDAVVRDWCTAAVGAKAGPFLSDYFFFWENYWKTKATLVGQFWNRREATYLQRGHFSAYIYGLEPGDMAHCRALMERVVAEAKLSGTSDQKERAVLLMTLFEWYEAAAIAASAEPIDSDGLIPDSGTAVSLLKNIPAAVEARERWRRILQTTPEWIAADMIIARQDRPGVVAFNMAQVSPFSGDTGVASELQAIDGSKTLPDEIRALARVLQTKAGEISGERVSMEDFEEGDTESKWIVPKPLGQVSRSPDGPIRSNHSLELTIDRPGFTVTREIPEYDPEAEYYVRAKILISEGQTVDANATAEFWGQPLPTGWNQPSWSLKPGVVKEVFAYIPRQWDGIRFAGRSSRTGEKLLARSAKPVDDDAAKAGQLKFRLNGGAVGTRIRLDDVEIFKLPVSKG